MDNLSHLEKKKNSPSFTFAAYPSKEKVKGKFIIHVFMLYIQIYFLDRKEKEITCCVFKGNDSLTFPV